MRFNLKNLLTRNPETITPEGVSVSEFPIEELGLTVSYIVFAGIWFVFAEDVFDWIMGSSQGSPALQAMRGTNFVLTTGLILYLVLRRAFRKRRLAQEALRLSQERFEAVAVATTDAIWDLNLNTKVVWWNEGIQKLFGYQPQDVSSKFDWWLEHVHRDDRDKVTQSIQIAADGGARTWSGEYRFERKDETFATVLDRGFIIRGAAGKPVRLVGGICDISERRHAERALENSREQLRALTARLQAGREEERAKVAREIHDDLGQTLTALKMDLDWIERRIADRKEHADLNPVLERIVESGNVIEAAIQSVQRIATDLRPAVLDNLGLVEALKEEARRFETRSGIKLKLDLPAAPTTLPRETATAIFRVCQEALTNVARHAKATIVNVSLQPQDGQILLKVEDNGSGIPLEAIGDPRSLGLLGMAERALALGGNASVAPVVPRGTCVTLRLPRTENANNPPAQP